MSNNSKVLFVICALLAVMFSIAIWDWSKLAVENHRLVRNNLELQRSNIELEQANKKLQHYFEFVGFMGV